MCYDANYGVQLANKIMPLEVVYVEVLAVGNAHMEHTNEVLVDFGVVTIVSDEIPTETKLSLPKSSRKTVF